MQVVPFVQMELPDLQDQMEMLEASALARAAIVCGDVTQAAEAAALPEPEAAEVLAALSGSVQQ